MNPRELTEDEYQYQYFKHFSATSFVSSYKKSVASVISEAINKVQDSVESKEEVVEDFEKLRERYMEQLDIAIAKIESIGIGNTMRSGLQTSPTNQRILIPAKQFFAIPENIVLKSDKPYQEYKNDIEILEEEIKEQEKDFLQQKMYISLLEKELENMKKIAPLISSVGDLNKMVEFKLRQNPESAYVADSVAHLERNVQEHLSEEQQQCNINGDMFLEKSDDEK